MWLCATDELLNFIIYFHYYSLPFKSIFPQSLYFISLSHSKMNDSITKNNFKNQNGSNCNYRETLNIIFNCLEIAFQRIFTQSLICYSYLHSHLFHFLFQRWMLLVRNVKNSRYQSGCNYNYCPKFYFQLSVGSFWYLKIHSFIQKSKLCWYLN